MHTNQILTKQNRSTCTLVRVLFADFACHSYHGNVFISCSFTFLVVVLGTIVSSPVNEGTVRSIKLQHSWKEQLSCSCLVDKGTVPPIKNNVTHA